MKKTPTPLSGYPEFLGKLKSRIQSARISAARAVNKDLIPLYWDIGEAIVEKQKQLGWGDSIVETLWLQPVAKLAKLDDEVDDAR